MISLDSQPCLICTIPWGICSVLKDAFYCFISPTFWEGGPKRSNKLEVPFRATWSWGSIPTFSEVSAIISGLPCPSGRYCMLAFLGDTSWSLSYLREWGLRCYQMVCFAIESNVQGSFSLPSVHVVTWLIRSWGDVFPHLCFVVAVFPLVLLSRRG